MRTIIAILILNLFSLTGFSQNKSKLLKGNWILEKQVSKSGEECGSANNIKITFNSDNTYFTNYGTTGKWEVKGKKIRYYSSKLKNPSDGTIADHSYKFKLINDGKTLVLKEPGCDESLEGSSYYKKE